MFAMDLIMSRGKLGSTEFDFLFHYEFNRTYTFLASHNHFFVNQSFYHWLIGVSVNFPDLQGNTPLHYAAKYGNFELCKVLEERGASAGITFMECYTSYTG